MAPSWQEVEQQRNALLNHALARNTLRTYRTGINHYRTFCYLYHVDPLPLSEHTLENFCVYLHTRVSFKAIKVYLCGVQFCSKMHGDTTIISQMLRLEYVIMAIRRVQGNSFARPARPPITWDMIIRICQHVSQTESSHDGTMLQAVTLLAFFGLLRVSEYTSPTPNLVDPATLMVSDVRIDWQRRVALVNIKQSKTDPFRQGVTIRVGVMAHNLCPVRAMARYLAVRGVQTGPLFIFRNGMFLTRARVLDMLTCALPDVPFVNTHSFRRGGASALASAGTSEELIQILGRWKSKAYRDYITFTDEFIATAQERMVQQ